MTESTTVESEQRMDPGQRRRVMGLTGILACAFAVIHYLIGRIPADITIVALSFFLLYANISLYVEGVLFDA